MTAVAPQAHYLSIHYLRAIAALMVVAVHSFSYGLVPIHDPPLVDWLKNGVAIFFVISGFVMVTSTSGKPIGPAGFMRRRIIRIVPLYWIITIAWMFVLGAEDFGHLAGSLMFLPSPDPVTGIMRSPLLEPGWTLNFEMLFYVLFAAMLVLPERFRFWAIAAVLGGFSQLGQWVELPPYLAWFSQPILLLFIAGMAIAKFDLRLPWWCALIGFAALAVGPHISDNKYLIVQLPAVAIILGARSLDGRLPQWKLPNLLGDASYAIYLSHLFLIKICLFLMPFGVPALPKFLIVMGLCAWFGVVVHRTLEQPVTTWCNAWFKRGRPDAGPKPAASV